MSLLNLDFEGSRSQSDVSRSSARMRGLHHVRETDSRVLLRQRKAEARDARLHSLLEGEVRLRRNKTMQPAGSEATRLSAYLRTYGAVSSESSRQPVLIDESVVRRKQKRRKASSGSEKKWCEVKEEVLARCSRQDQQKVSLFCGGKSVGAY